MTRIDKDLQRITRMTPSESQLTAFCRLLSLTFKTAPRDYAAHEKILTALLRAEHASRAPIAPLTVTSKAIAHLGTHLRRNATFAGRLNNLAIVLSELRRFEGGLALHEEALAIKRQALPANDPSIANSLNNMANVLYELRRFEEALERHEEALAIKRQALPANDPSIADSLMNSASVLANLRRFEEALERHEEALAIKRQVLPANHPLIAASLMNSANVLNELRRFEEALERHEEALAIKRQALPANDPSIADSLMNSANVLDELRRFEEALERHEEALATRRQALPANHPDIADSLMNSANVLSELRRFDEALERHEEALAIWRQVLPENHPDIADCLMNSANVLSNLRRFDEALERHEEALAIWRQVLPENHLDIANSLNNLGYVHEKLGQFEGALALHEEALAIWRQVLPEDHPDIALSLHNMGLAQMGLGRHEAAVMHLNDALRIRRIALPADHPHIAKALHRLAKVHGVLEQPEQGICAAAEGLEILLRNEQFPLTNKQLWGQAHSVEEDESVPATLALLLDLVTQREDPSVTDEVVSALLTYKGNADIEQGLASILQATAPEGSALRILLDRRQQLQGEMARLQYSTDEQDLVRLATVSQDLRGVEQQLEKHEEGRRLAEELQLRMISADRVRSALQAGEALLNLFVLQEGIYAQVLHADGRHHLHHYDASELEAQVMELRQVLEDQNLLLHEQAVLAPLQQLYTALISPIAELLGLGVGLERLVISGDGFLYSLPWDLLCTPGLSTAEPLLAQLNVRLVPTPRDLVRLHDLQGLHTPTPNPAVMLGVQSFELEDLSLSALNPAVQATEGDIGAGMPLTEASLPSAVHRGATGFATRSAVATEGGNADLPRYANLQGTREEIEQLTTLLTEHGRDVVAHFSPEASEHTLLNVGIAPWVLHFSTHSDVWEAQQTETLYQQTHRADPRYDPTHPFSRAVVLLDGYTRRNFKGVLRAWELGSLNLHGTELVAFSSCNSGLGDMTAGRGVAGLSQAAFLAGAQRTITTLWPVLDQTTPEWMRNVYAARLQGSCWQDAVRAEKLRMLGEEQPVSAWAPFVLNGLA